MPFEELRIITSRLNDPINEKGKKQTVMDLIRTSAIYLSSADSLVRKLQFPKEDTLENDFFSFFNDNPAIKKYIEEQANQKNFFDACRRQILESFNSAGFMAGEDKGEKLIEFKKDVDGSILVIETIRCPKTIYDMEDINKSYSSQESIATGVLVTRIREKDGVIAHSIESFEIIPGKSAESKAICQMLFAKEALRDLKKYMVGTEEYKSKRDTTSVQDLQVSKAIRDRGVSFINAARLMVNNLGPEDIERINSYPQEKFPIRKALMEGVSPKYWEKIKNKSNVELITDYLAMLEKHWQNRLTKYVPPVLDKKDLAALEKELIEAIRHNVYAEKKDKAGKKIGFDKVKKELEDAENHVCWKVREKRTCAMEGVRTEEPITTFTPSQTDEWLSILKPKLEERPKWFTELPSWEQRHLTGRVEAWLAQKELSSGVKNLGDFLGPVPTTIRRYPGAANAYKTKYTVTGEHGTQTFYKVRTGYLSPFDVKNFDEKVKIARQNIEQLLAASFPDYIAAERTRLGLKEGEPLTISMPLLIQTLHSPPFQPGGRGNNDALFKAIDQIQAELTRKDSTPNEFLKGIGVAVPKEVTVTEIEVLSSNRPVNSARGISSFLSFFSRQGSENNKTLDRLGEHLNSHVRQAEIRQIPVDPGIKMAQVAMQTLREQNTFASTFSLNNLLAKIPGIGRFFQPESNVMAERAALEQIVASKTGIRMGSCVSGKDREEMVTEMALVMTEFYAKYGRMPPPANCKKEDRALRDEFVQKMAEHFLSGHGQMLAGENAAGCNGLKNVKYVFGGSICARIISLARERGMPGDPLETTAKIAGINKLKKDKVKKKSLDLVRADYREQAILSHAGSVLAPTKKDEEEIQTMRHFAHRETSVELVPDQLDASLSAEKREQLLQRKTTAILPTSIAHSHAVRKKIEPQVSPPHEPSIKHKN